MTTLQVAGPALQAKRLAHADQQKLQANGDVRAFFTSANGLEDKAALRSLLNDCEAVWVYGGDGTLHAVINALGNNRPVITLVACGSGNDTAAGLGLADNDWRWLPQSTVVLSAIAEIDGIRFINSAGIGLSPQVNNNIPRVVKRLLQKLGIAHLSYAIGLLVWLFNQRSVQFNGKAMLAVTWHIGPRFGGGFYLAEDTDRQRQSVTQVAVEKISRWQQCRLICAVLRRRYPRQWLTEQVQEQEQPLLSDATMVEMDGETYHLSPKHLRILPQPARFRVPIHSQNNDRTEQ
ncbi:hypothetical protein CWI84_01120 [Idiomarina tyrosinivorans]|uniref:DAGKc domain-containing protein n=1 Tax=Idiomarina tyrosinivorans TaxID=1445662 RepID=A0A432ZU98_9GAMM|nr:diacylglycerol kinase family protein [Idiomarina tyrosinivorans]RUO81388.1 hypothetical protein CWI84_01120 [Idiomarina tyrosinivorans]